MRKQTFLASFVMTAFVLTMMIAPATSAPMFPDLPQEHWAKDAVAALAAKGLVEGYPDGTFKGDRAATRYEVAMIVARLLAKIEAEHATFATKADLDALRKLVNQLKDELDALGVRVQNLEENVGRLDKRVTELERIRFYGFMDSRFTSQGFQNNGLTLGTGGSVAGQGPVAFGATNYNTAIGRNQTGAGFFATGEVSEPSGTTGARINFMGANTNGSGLPDAGVTGFVNKNVPLVVPVLDYLNGTPLTNGTGFSTNTTLGARIKVSDEIDAGVEFSAFVQAGDSIVDAFFGANAPYLANQFQGNPGTNAALGIGNQSTSMNLDNFWMIYKPTGLKIQVGSFDGTNFDNNIYVGEYNPNPLGPRYLNNYGLDVRGHGHLIGDVNFEVMGTKLADGNQSPFSAVLANTQGGGQIAAQNPFGIFDAQGGYAAEAYGVNADWDLYGRGDFKLNFLRALDDTSNGGPLLVGQITGMNGVWLNWVNPNGFFVGQPGVQAENTLAGAGTNVTNVSGQVGTVGTLDNRPIFSANGVTASDSAGFLGGIQNTIPGTFGPQSETSFGASFKYKFEGPLGWRVFAQYGNTKYKPSINSSFNTTGNAFLGGLGVLLFHGAMDLTGEYVSTDPTYDPFMLQYPQIDGVANDYWRIRSFSYFPNAYPLHDTDEFPQNRNGYRLHLKLMAKDDKGERREFFHGWYYNLNQVQTSLPDQRFSLGSLGGGVPNANVLGFSPGFVEPVFGPESPFSFGASGANLFATPLDDNRGNQTQFGAHFRYRFGQGPWAFGIGYENLQFTRNTGLNPLGAGVGGAAGFVTAAGGNMNFVDLVSEGGVAQVNYTFSDKLVLKFGLSATNLRGHYDPSGIFNNFAFDTGTTNFFNINTTQNYPFVGFDYDISKNTRFNFNVKFFNTTDNIGQNTFITAAPLPSNIQRDPFNWTGVQVTSQVKVSF